MNLLITHQNPNKASPAETIQAEALALHILRQLAKKYVAVQLTIADCGCHTIELFADGEKICEEDKDLSVAVAAIVERLGDGR